MGTFQPMPVTPSKFANLLSGLLIFTHTTRRNAHFHHILLKKWYHKFFVCESNRENIPLHTLHISREILPFLWTQILHPHLGWPPQQGGCFGYTPNSERTKSHWFVETPYGLHFWPLETTYYAWTSMVGCAFDAAALAALCFSEQFLDIGVGEQLLEWMAEQ